MPEFSMRRSDLEGRGDLMCPNLGGVGVSNCSIWGKLVISDIYPLFSQCLVSIMWIMKWSAIKHAILHQTSPIRSLKRWCFFSLFNLFLCWSATEVWQTVYHEERWSHFYILEFLVSIAADWWTPEPNIIGTQILKDWQETFSSDFQNNGKICFSVKR